MTMREHTASNDRLTGVHNQLVEAVDKLVHSDAWATMLSVAARFPTYSPSNVLLIAVQRPDATRVGGIRLWNSLGRRVNKGEHGIAILAPCVYRQPADEPPQASPRSTHQPVDEPDDATKVLRGFKVVHVFDVSQTDGDPLPDAAPELLAGEAPTGLWDHLAELLHDSGYELSRGPCPAGVNGYTDPHTHLVRVRDDVEPAQAVKTLAHELAHIRADHFERFPDYAGDPRCRGQAEIEAESIAYVVSAHAGMHTDPYSVPYVSLWSDGDTARIRDCATRVITIARALIPNASPSTSSAGALVSSIRPGRIVNLEPSASANDLPAPM
jgi:antirestriction protein ArdC